ncbi:tyrosine-protein phosphatase [Halobacillus campisalis]|uniref:Tyrosine-protein phosphatase n=1 Tax=Halobacillus campisalis TaxID=435909 RepID=A0ABW2JZI1_9BACI|nr:CpsB/CapC family capsule biosynthesis tyrosine phosphatase [Halobacillus campisalis]
MIDLHSHILSGVDDGAQSLEESMAMAEAALQEGMDTLTATPHHLNGAYVNDKPIILKKVKDLNNELQKRKMELTVLPGQLTRLHGDLLDGLKNGTILTLNRTSPYVLIELPRDHVPQYTSPLLFNMQMEGYQPIIANPERNEYIQKHPNVLYTLVKNGAYSQVTAASLCGKHGRTARKLANQLIEAGLAHVIASDIHQLKKKKGFYMKEAYRQIEKVHGSSVVYTFMENAHYVIEGEALITDPPEHVIKNKNFSIF